MHLARQFGARLLDAWGKREGVFRATDRGRSRVGGLPRGPLRAGKSSVGGRGHFSGPQGRLPKLGDQLQAAGEIGTSRSFAKSGATAAQIGTNHFARQLRLWRDAGRPLGIGR